MNLMKNFFVRLMVPLSKPMEQLRRKFPWAQRILQRTTSTRLSVRTSRDRCWVQISSLNMIYWLTAAEENLFRMYETSQQQPIICAKISAEDAHAQISKVCCPEYLKPLISEFINISGAKFSDVELKQQGSPGVH